MRSARADTFRVFPWGARATGLAFIRTDPAALPHGHDQASIAKRFVLHNVLPAGALPVF